MAKEAEIEADIDALVVNELSKAEILRIINEFVEVMHPNDTSSAHHEEAKHFQLGFTKILSLKENRNL